MKILQINCVYPMGSTGKIVSDLHAQLLEKGYKSIICYGIGEKGNKKDIYKISNIVIVKFNALISRITGYMYGNCFYSTIKLIKKIKTEKPDIVHIHCINGHTVNIYKLITWLKENRINTVLTLHSEFMFTGNCGHSLECEKWKTGCGKCPRLKKETKSWFFDNTHNSWQKMCNAMKNFSNLKVVSVSPWLEKRAKLSPILSDKMHYVILNGIDTSIFKLYKIKELKEKMQLIDKKIIFHVTAKFNNDKNHIKGGYYILKLAELLKNEPIQIIVAGEYDKNIQIPSNITMLGKIINQEELAKYYSMADVTVLTSKRETFSMPVAESLCCGTPIVGFKAGAPEKIAIKEYSSFVEYGNMQELYESIKKFIYIEKNPLISKRAQEVYSRNTMTKKYIDIYRKF